MSVSGVNSAQSALETSAASNDTKTQSSTSSVLGGLDKNAFLKILCAELSNQDPTSSTDSTEYVAQMAQFAALEQIENLNSSMKFSSMASLIGKNVVLNSTDSDGNLYSGTVQSVSKSGDDITLKVKVGTKKDESGNTVDNVLEFSDDDIRDIKS